MKKVVLLGDSIRLLGYGKTVANALAGDFEVWQPGDNCRFATYTLRGTFDWRESIKDADIIHWNNGLWDIHRIVNGDVFTPIDQYVSEMVRIAKVLLQCSKIVIFATTTPVREGHPDFRNGDIAAYNIALLPRLQELGVVINDLHALVEQDAKRYICEDLVHLSEAGIAVCAAQVERIIRQQAEKL